MTSSDRHNEVFKNYTPINNNNIIKIKYIIESSHLIYYCTVKIDLNSNIFCQKKSQIFVLMSNTLHD